jgi:signal transduction histidine kinase
MLYTRLAGAIILLRRERADRLMSVDVATAAIAHELAQPLSGVSLHCSAALNWFKRTPPVLEKIHTSVTAALSSGERAKEIIASTREMFKPATHYRTPTDLNGVARQVLGMLEHDLHEHSVSVSTNFQENLPQIMADRTQLQQVVLNLVRNAIDAMQSRPINMRSLWLVTTYDGNSVVTLSVQDSGPGIDSGDEARIFDAFYTTKPSGLGLGLSICRKIVEAHGGELQLARKGSTGCRFEVSLPSAAMSEGILGR